MRRWRVRKGAPGRGHSQCKGPEAGSSLACVKNSLEVEGYGEGKWEWGVGSGPHRALWAAVRRFLSKALGSHGEALSRGGSHRMNGLVGRIIAPKVAIVLNLDPVNKVPCTVSRDE